MTADLVQFLRARLDEDALWATEASRREGEAAIPGGAHWNWVDLGTDEPVTPDPGTEALLNDEKDVGLRSRETWPTYIAGIAPMKQTAICYAEEVDAAVGGHIIRHDPARVLAEVDAKRQTLGLHSAMDSKGERITGCTTCSWRDNMDDLGVWWPCPTLRLMLIPYTDHPDYRAEWVIQPQEPGEG